MAPTFLFPVIASPAYMLDHRVLTFQTDVH